MIEQRQDIANIVMRAFGSMPEPATWRDREETSYALADAILALIQKEQGWRPDYETLRRSLDVLMAANKQGGGYWLHGDHVAFLLDELIRPGLREHGYYATPPQGEDG